jgi:curli biogenesis system outer membrane secretion channel CsgG
MRGDLMATRVKSALGLLAAACCVALSASAASAAGSAEVNVVVVRASPAGDTFVDPAIDETVAKRLAKLAQFKRFTAEKGLTQVVAWGEKATLQLNDGGRFEATARQGAEAGKIELDLAETAPGAKQPCVQTSLSGQAGQRHLVFCDAPSSEGTLLFFVAARPSP